MEQEGGGLRGDGRSCRNWKGCIQENIVINNLILYFTVVEDNFLSEKQHVLRHKAF